MSALVPGGLLVELALPFGVLLALLLPVPLYPIHVPRDMPREFLVAGLAYRPVMQREERPDHAHGRDHRDIAADQQEQAEEDDGADP